MCKHIQNGLQTVVNLMQIYSENDVRIACFLECEYYGFVKLHERDCFWRMLLETLNKNECTLISVAVPSILSNEGEKDVQTLRINAS